MFHNMSFMGMWWLWLIIIAAVVLIIFFSINNSKVDTSKILNETPLDLLKKKYAGGEIDKQEFEEKKKDLLN